MVMVLPWILGHQELPLLPAQVPGRRDTQRAGTEPSWCPVNPCLSPAGACPKSTAVVHSRRNIYIDFRKSWI